MFDVLGPKGAEIPGAITPWFETITVGKDIFDLYESRGDLVSTGPINIPSVQDGPGVVVMYDDLTLNHVLSTTNRCRSLTVLVRGNLVINAGGGISMTARGARGHAGMGLYDGYIPESIDLASKHLLLADVLQYVKTNAIDVTDRWFWDDWSRTMGVTATFNQGGALILLSAAGCGAALATRSGNNNSCVIGNAGTNGGPGGGGHGFQTYYSGTGGQGRSGKGCPWGGGGGSAGIWGTASGVPPDADQHGGVGGPCALPGISASVGTQPDGGGAGNPGGVGGAAGCSGADGTGGVLRIIVKGSVTINSGGIIQADGAQGGNTTNAATQSSGGGGSGGGHISIITLGSFTNNGTVRANGGLGGLSAYNTTLNGGAGGAGSVVIKTFAQMGW